MGLRPDRRHFVHARPFALSASYTLHYPTHMTPTFFFRRQHYGRACIVGKAASPYPRTSTTWPWQGFWAMLTDRDSGGTLKRMTTLSDRIQCGRQDERSR